MCWSSRLWFLGWTVFWELTSNCCAER